MGKLPPSGPTTIVTPWVLLVRRRSEGQHRVGVAPIKLGKRAVYLKQRLVPLRQMGQEGGEVKIGEAIQRVRRRQKHLAKGPGPVGQGPQGHLLDGAQPVAGGGKVRQVPGEGRLSEGQIPRPPGQPRFQDPRIQCRIGQPP